jgi:hypothetical protein
VTASDAFNPAKRREVLAQAAAEDDDLDILFTRRAPAASRRPLVGVPAPAAPAQESEPERDPESPMKSVPSAAANAPVAPVQVVGEAPRKASRKPGTPAYVHQDLKLWMSQRAGQLTAQRGKRVTYTDLFFEALDEAGANLGSLFTTIAPSASGMPRAPRKLVVSGGVQISLALIDAQEQWMSAKETEYGVSRSVFVTMVLEHYREQHSN